jgi:hypothetical protein
LCDLRAQIGRGRGQLGVADRRCTSGLRTLLRSRRLRLLLRLRWGRL